MRKIQKMMNSNTQQQIVEHYLDNQYFSKNASTSYFKFCKDYQEAFTYTGKNPIYIGSQKLSWQQRKKSFGDMKMDILKNKKKSLYYGCILCPERRNEKWEYFKNKAFSAGGIDKTELSFY